MIYYLYKGQATSSISIPRMENYCLRCGLRITETQKRCLIKSAVCVWSKFSAVYMFPFLSLAYHSISGLDPLINGLCLRYSVFGFRTILSPTRSRTFVACFTAGSMYWVSWNAWDGTAIFRKSRQAHPSILILNVCGDFYLGHVMLRCEKYVNNICLF